MNARVDCKACCSKKVDCEACCAKNRKGSGGPGGTFSGGIKCAREGGKCSFSGKADVKYGARDKWVTRTFTGGTMCTNSVFGNPIRGTVKECYYRRAAGGKATHGAHPMVAAQQATQSQVAESLLQVNAGGRRRR